MGVRVYNDLCALAVKSDIHASLPLPPSPPHDGRVSRSRLSPLFRSQDMFKIVIPMREPDEDDETWGDTRKRERSAASGEHNITFTAVWNNGRRVVHVGIPRRLSFHTSVAFDA